MQGYSILTPLFFILCVHAKLQNQYHFQTSVATSRPQIVDVIRTSSDKTSLNKNDVKRHRLNTVRETPISSNARSSLPSVKSGRDQLSVRRMPSTFSPYSQSSPQKFFTKDSKTKYLPPPSQSHEMIFQNNESDDAENPLSHDKLTISKSKVVVQHKGKSAHSNQKTSNALSTKNDVRVPNTPVSEVVQGLDDESVDIDSYMDFPNEVEAVIPSPLLRDAFLDRNPGITLGHFASMTDDAHSFNPLHNMHKRKTQSMSEGAPLSVRKRDDESVPENYSNGRNMADDSNISIDQRSRRCTPDVLVGDEWVCHQRFDWRFLGENVYPSRLYEVVCEGTCWNGHFNCTPITYTVHVLQWCLHGCYDQRVPSPLRSRWQWNDLNVTVGCQCVR